MKTLSGALFASFSFLFYENSNTKNSGDDLTTTRNAICILYPDNNSGTHGLVSFQQQNITTACKIMALVKGLKPNGSHGFHIHEFGDVTEGCKTAGPHYNPFNKNHGGPLDKERHIGDLGNLKADGSGVAHFSTQDPLIKLFGDTTVVGRSCVVHEGEDDLGKGNFPDSLTTGHSGGRIACGVIGLSSTFKILE
jgi:Cu-Zn family superoxide dismutase